MTLCINPCCDQPDNPDNAQFCQNCQSSLLLKQRYRATKVLGNGGFGKTYEAADLGVRNKVIKVLINNSPKAVELFQREAEVLSQLDNPGIPKVEPNSYTVFHPADGQAPVHCLVMEKVEGMNLRDYLKQLRHPIDSETAERWFKELVLILQAVHEQGILHRDIKPQNIIFKPDGSLALIDFGAVREGTGTQVATSAAGGGTEVASYMAAGTTVSSVGYTAPEQMNGQVLKQSDFYSLGKTFIFLLTGKEPSEIPYDAYNDGLKWREYVPNVNQKLADLLDKMTATLVRQRPADSQELLQALNSKQSPTFSTPARPEAKQIPVTPSPEGQPVSTKLTSSASKSGGIFWKWFWLSLGGFITGLIGLFIVAVICSGVTGWEWDQVVTSRFTSSVMWGTFGLILGTFQWFSLKQKMPNASSWIGATTIGFVIYGSLMASSGYMRSTSTISTDPVLEIGIGLIGGGLIGLAQWLNYLRKHFSQSAWWILLAIASSSLVSLMTLVSPILAFVPGILIDPILSGWGINRLYNRHSRNANNT
ncbi:protein kinase [Thermoleptolyngbya oregonensis NK1-22]|uniref:non-specific serine/threonine protein kinase n=1 Tax=Thermoleptolyngbya oregonensis NK1-22 TaxID=2547457 RepID=A0AA97BKT3_9CYAN|nr:protein kinase [Thermoleptolyngbya oregonensis NK1-22]